MKNIPTQTENPKGLHQRFHIEKLNGETDPKAEYFVLRLDSNGKDPNHINACRIGIQAYANAIEPFIPELANDLRERYPARQPVRKTLDRYDIDFGGNVMAGIEVDGQINIVGAMDGYGNGISLDKIIITPNAQTKAVEPQEGWVDVTPETMPKDYGNFLVSDKDGAIDLNHFDGEHFYDHWGNRNYPAFYMPLPEPPSHPNQQLTSNRDDYLW